MTYDVIYDGKNKWRYKICEICFGSQSSFVSWKINTSQCFTNCMWKQKTKKNTAVEKKTTVVFFLCISRIILPIKEMEMMYSFKNDYSEGALPAIMELLNKSNFEQTNGYGEDYFCEEAKKKIKDRLQYKACDVHFLVGGTQTNLTVIASALRPYEAVIAADTGHINVHETGAIEASGHKVLTVKGTDGKVTSEAVRKVVLDHEDEHMVKPTMVYISNATEIGTMYLKEELQELYATCKELGLYLFMDGARLGSALMAQNNNITWEDLCSLCDVFYIGGTKNGTLFGEALVIVNEELKKDFRYMIKQRGGLLAKGRLFRNSISWPF